MDLIPNKTILNKTGGFLGQSFTHTINPYSGCSFAKAMCGTFCYAQHFDAITKGRPWGIYGLKANAQEAYRKDWRRIKVTGRSAPSPIKVFMASVTDPYVPQEKKHEVTKGILEEMVTQPPDVLVIQTHGTMIERDLELIGKIPCTIYISISIETDMERVPGLPPHAASPKSRMEVLKKFKDAGISTQATVSPLMPLSDPEAFAKDLSESCDRIILDHYLLGDGSGGSRTVNGTDIVKILEENGFGEWTGLAKFNEVCDIFRNVAGADRVLVSESGFNTI